MRYLKILNKNNFKFILGGFILGELFKFVGLNFWIGAFILYGVWLVLDLYESAYFKGKFKIRHKDICK
ncbi:MAG: hypothetical protein ACRCWM_13040 [Sarcina sp.]